MPEHKMPAPAAVLAMSTAPNRTQSKPALDKPAGGGTALRIVPPPVSRVGTAEHVAAPLEKPGGGEHEHEKKSHKGQASAHSAQGGEAPSGVHPSAKSEHHKSGKESKEEEAHPKGKGQGEGGEHTKGKGGPHAEGGKPEAKGAKGGGGEVHLKMPEPPSSPSPATQKRIAGVKAAAGTATAANTALPSAAQSAAAAHGAVNEPPEQAQAKAQANLISALDAQPAPSPEIEAICLKIKKAIHDKRPPDEDSLVDADPKAMAAAASGDVKGGVEGETKKVETGYDGINQSPQGAPPAQGQAMTPPPVTVDSPPVNAARATPDAVPAQNVSLKADAADSKQSMDDAGMNKPTAELVKSGPIADAKAGQQELDQKADQDPAIVLAKQQESLNKAQGDMAALQQQALSALTSSRKSTVVGTTGNQQGMVLSEEQQRTLASADSQKIFQGAQTTVDALLKDVTPKAMQLWDQRIEILTTKFKQRLKKVAEWIADRHSGAGGAVLGALDYFTGLPDWVTDEYDAAEKEFGDSVCDLAREISIQVNSVIMACEAIIKRARKEIDDIFAKLPDSLRKWAEGEQAKLGEQLDGLNQKAQQTRADFDKQLVQHASQAVQDVRQEIHALREAAKGLIGKIADAVNRFLDDPNKFIIDGLLELVGISPAAFWALIDKIRQVISDIADDPGKFANNLFEGLAMGFSQFFDHFPEHLKEAFLSWLLGGIAAAGINLPKDFSLKSIMTFFLELMGITWPNIRKILAKHVGEKNIALIEKVVSLMSTLIELGPSGVFEMIKEKLNPAEILQQLVKMAIDYLVEAMVKQAVARIVMLFNPVGAILQAIEAIYRVLKWIFHNAARIFKLIETVVNGVADIMAGNIGGFAKAVETGLAMMIAPVIDFIADYLGLGDLPAKVKERIEGFQGIVLGYVEQAIVFLIAKGKALLKFLGFGGKDDKSTSQPGTDKQTVGEPVEFSAGGDTHHVWVEIAGNNAVIMVGSRGQAVLDFLNSPRINQAVETDEAVPKAERKDLKGLLADIRKCVNKTDNAADSTLRAMEAKQSAQTGTQNDAVKKDEHELASLLAKLMAAVSPGNAGGVSIFDVIGKAAPPDPPEGYRYLKIDGAQAIQREGGKGPSAGKKAYPEVYIDDAKFVRTGSMRERLHQELAAAYQAMDKSRLTEAEQQSLDKQIQGFYGQLARRSIEHLDRGIRDQARRILDQIGSGKVIVGIEDDVGEGRIDYVVREISHDVMIEVKSWRAELTSSKLRALKDQGLFNQLQSFLISAQGTNRKELRIEWIGFGKQDPTTQAHVTQTIEQIIQIGKHIRIEVKLIKI